MSDQSSGASGGPSSSSSSSSSSEPVGSVGEEAAKLFAALSGWAKDQGGDLGGSAAAAFSSLQDINEHIATGSEDCRYCPVCQVIHAVRATSPEVKAHLAVAASSLMQAAAGVLATQAPPNPTSPVEKINIDDDEAWDE